MPGLLAADDAAGLEHALEHVSVADAGDLDLAADALHVLVEADVAHDGGGDQVVLETAFFLEHLCTDADHFVAVDDPALFVDRDQTVRIAVVRHAHERAFVDDRFAESFRVGGTAVLVDVEPVRRIADHGDIRAERFIHLARDRVRRAVGAIQHKFDTGQVHRCRVHEKVDIFLRRILIRDDMPAETVPGDVLVDFDVTDNDILDLVFNGIVQFEPFPVEELDAVVLKRIVGSGDHNTRIHLIMPHQISDRGGRHHADGDHVRADCLDPGGKRRFQHIRRDTGIRPDQDLRTALALAQHMCTGFAQRKCQLRRQLAVRNTAHAVSTK